MALRLRIVSEHATRLGEKGTKVFSVHGGTIGRATDNDWILPDPERYLSGKHARVDFRAGTYFLVDTSSNGTYVNGAQIPLGKYHDYALKDGDYVRLGEYELLVSIDPSNDFPPDEGAIVAYDGGSPSAAVKKSTANDIGADLDLSELLEPSNNLDSDIAGGFGPSNAYGQPVTPEPVAGETPWHMVTRPLNRSSAVAPPSPPPVPSSSAASPRAAVNPPLYDGDVDIGLSAFCRGAGIDPRMVSPEARANALQLAGQLLREAVVGVMDLNQARGEFRNRFRMSPPTADGQPSTTFTSGVEDTLVRLLTTLSARAGSVEAMRENFRDLKAQNAATLAAMRAALEELLARFAPKDLEERFERGVRRGVFGQNKAKYWDLYGELYASLSQSPPEGFPHLFVEAFAKAYEAKMQALMPPKRGAFSGEPGVGDSHHAANGDR
jgi:type VI secretion system protein